MESLSLSNSINNPPEEARKPTRGDIRKPGKEGNHSSNEDSTTKYRAKTKANTTHKIYTVDAPSMTIEVEEELVKDEFFCAQLVIS